LKAEVEGQFHPSAFILSKMSCDNGQKRAVEAATRSGIAAGVSKKAFYLGTAAAGTVLGGLLLSRYFSRRQQTSPTPVKPTTPEQVKPLTAPERIGPIAAERLPPGQRCAKCKTLAQGKGAWYNLGGRVYCQQCAQGQAGKAGVSLARPVVARRETAVKYPQTGRRTTLKPRMVKVGPVENVEGYAVWTGQKDTGLTLVPEVKVAAGGQAKINKSRWFINYDRAGKPVAGPYRSVSEARGMASLLAHFDWTRGVERFTDEEIRAVTRLTREYREDLDFKEHMQQISQ
jgi:hypothetical protein